MTSDTEVVEAKIPVVSITGDPLPIVGICHLQVSTRVGETKPHPFLVTPRRLGNFEAILGNDWMVANEANLNFSTGFLETCQFSVPFQHNHVGRFPCFHISISTPTIPPEPISTSTIPTEAEGWGGVPHEGQESEGWVGEAHERRVSEGWGGVPHEVGRNGEGRGGEPREVGMGGEGRGGVPREVKIGDEGQGGVPCEVKSGKDLGKEKGDVTSRKDVGKEDGQLERSTDENNYHGNEFCT